MFMDLKEKTRLKTISLLEKKLFREGYFTIAGVDEAGRGPLAGPVVSAAVIEDVFSLFLLAIIMPLDSILKRR